MKKKLENLLTKTAGKLLFKKKLRKTIKFERNSTK